MDAMVAPKPRRWVPALVTASLLLVGLSQALPALAPPPPGEPPADVAPSAGIGGGWSGPVVFEQNLGQADPAVRFVARAPHTTLLLREDGFDLAAGPGAAREAASLRFVGADPGLRVAGVDPLPSASSYYRGADPARWVEGAPHFASVRYEGVWPGADVVVYATPQRELEYDVVLAPGADPHRARMRVEGPGEPSLSPAGELLLGGQGALRLRAPVARQPAPGGALPVEAAFALQGREVGFRLGAYDRGLPLVIDPVIAYSTFLGGSAQDIGHGAGRDELGFLYAAGESHSLNFPLVNPVQPSNAGYEDGWMLKLSPDGQSLVYATYIGGSLSEADTLRFAVSPKGVAALAAYTSSPDYPTSPGAFQLDQPFNDIGVTVLDPLGQLLYSTYVGSSAPDDFLGGLDVDDDGRAYVSFTTDYQAFPLVNPIQPWLGPRDAVLAVLNPTGTALEFSSPIGGSGHDDAGGVSLEAVGRVWLTGSTSSADFPVTSGAWYGSFSGGVADAFVVRLDDLLGAPAVGYGTYLGGPHWDVGHAIDFDDKGGLAVAMRTYSSTGVPIVNAAQPTPSFNPDVHLTVFRPDMSNILTATFLGGNAWEYPRGVAVDDCGQATVVGITGAGMSFPSVNAPFTHANGAGGFVARYKGFGGYSYVGRMDSHPWAVAVHPHSALGDPSVLVAGHAAVNHVQVNPVQGPGGAADAFLTRILQPVEPPKVTLLEPKANTVYVGDNISVSGNWIPTTVLSQHKTVKASVIPGDCALDRVEYRVNGVVRHVQPPWGPFQWFWDFSNPPEPIGQKTLEVCAIGTDGSATCASRQVIVT